MLVVLIASILFPTTASASSYAKNAMASGLPTRNIGMMRAHCLARVEHGSISISSSAGSNPSFVQVMRDGKGDEDVVGQLMGFDQWNFEVSNMSAPVSVRFVLTDNSNNTLFLDDKETSWTQVSEDKVWLKDASLQRKLVGNPAISVPGAISARIYATEKATGRSYSEAFEVKNGLLIEYYTFWAGSELEGTYNGMVEITFQEDDGTTSVQRFGLDGTPGSDYKKPTINHAAGTLFIGNDDTRDMGINPSSLEVGEKDSAEKISRLHFRFETIGTEQVLIKLGTLGVVGTPKQQIMGIIGILYRDRNPQFNNYPWSFFQFNGSTASTFSPGVKYDMVYVQNLYEVPADAKVVTTTASQ